MNLNTDLLLFSLINSIILILTARHGTGPMFIILVVKGLQDMVTQVV
jgi:hypothetical protein